MTYESEYNSKSKNSPFLIIKEDWNTEILHLIIHVI